LIVLADHQQQGIHWAVFGGDNLFTIIGREDKAEIVIVFKNPA
jgi:hypothetical protein